MMTNLSRVHLEYMRIPLLYWNAKLDYIPKHCFHKNVVENYVKNIDFNVTRGVGLLLNGNYSMGKSAIASIILKAAANKGFFGLWINSRELAKIIIDDEQFNEDETISERICNCPILVLDELIIEKNNKDNFVEDIVRRRISGVKTTIITTNLSPDEIRQKAPALAQALKEAIVPIAVGGHDFREEKKHLLIKALLQE